MAWAAKQGQTRTGQRYDTHHKKARAAHAARHHPTDPCVRCGHPLGPIGPGLHLDHAEDGTYLGFAHGHPCPTCKRRCNQRAGSLKGNAIQTAHRQPRTTWTSRRW